jgi:hypothetical protein
VSPIKEFLTSERDEPVKFKVDDDVFVAVAPNKLPANVLIGYAENVSMGRTRTAHLRLFADVLEEESHTVFAARLDSRDNPITLHTMADVANWLIQDIYAGKAKGLL